LISTERTLKLKVEDLEYENAKLRKMLEEEKASRKQDEETQRQMYQNMLQINAEPHEEAQGKPLRNLENKINNIEKGYILKEVELKAEISRLAKIKGTEIELVKKHFEAERQNYENALANKEKEIEGFRHELESVLSEMDSMRKRTERNF